MDLWCGALGDGVEDGFGMDPGSAWPTRAGLRSLVDPRPSLISVLCGWRGMKQRFSGVKSGARPETAIGFGLGHAPCHMPLTGTLCLLDAQAVADILGAVVLADDGGPSRVRAVSISWGAADDTFA